VLRVHFNFEDLSNIRIAREASLGAELLFSLHVLSDKPTTSGSAPGVAPPGARGPQSS